MADPAPFQDDLELIGRGLVRAFDVLPKDVLAAEDGPAVSAAGDTAQPKIGLKVLAVDVVFPLALSTEGSLTACKVEDANKDWRWRRFRRFL